jgi:hypothetical protein
MAALVCMRAANPPNKPDRITHKKSFPAVAPYKKIIEGNLINDALELLH